MEKVGRLGIPGSRDRLCPVFARNRQTIIIGKQISLYHILEKLGEGRMEVICLAKDTKLNPQVNSSSKFFMKM